jgi:hypothetical protein
MSATMDDLSPVTTNALLSLPNKGALPTVKARSAVLTPPPIVAPVVSIVTSTPSMNNR